MSVPVSVGITAHSRIHNEAETSFRQTMEHLNVNIALAYKKIVLIVTIVK
jgi:hypothetical protein